MDNDQLLSRLYSLRAGMSVVSLEKDKADKIGEDAKNDYDGVLALADEKINKCENEVKIFNDILQSERKRISKLHSDANRGTKDLYEKRIHKDKIAIIIYSVVIAICLVATAWVIAYFAMNHGNDAYNNTVALVFGCCIPFVTVPCLIVFPILIKKKADNISATKSKISHDEKVAKDAQKELKSADNDIKTAQNDCERALRELERVKSASEKNCRNAKDKYKDLKSEADSHKTAGAKVVMALNDTFSDIIDYRDWENLDYIIFCLETRRADNMKEALQLTDEEKRTNRIVNAIHNASKEICRTLEFSISRLQNDMHICFNILNDNMNIQAQQIMKNIDRVKTNVALQSSSLLELTSAVNLSNSLRAKVNATSKQLAEDIEYIRKYA